MVILSNIQSLFGTFAIHKNFSLQVTTSATCYLMRVGEAYQKASTLTNKEYHKYVTTTLTNILLQYYFSTLKIANQSHKHKHTPLYYCTMGGKPNHGVILKV